MKVRYKLSSMVLCLCALACNSEGSFGGSASRSEKQNPRENPPKLAKAKPRKKPISNEVLETAQEKAASIPESAHSIEEPLPTTEPPSDPKDAEILQSTPEQPLDIRQSGFVCPTDMSAAEGPWEGSWDGGIFKGNIQFRMQNNGQDSLHIEDYKISGGAISENEVANGVIDFTLRCADHSFPMLKVTYMGMGRTTTYTLERQSWSPPTLRGTWISTADLGLDSWSGTWIARKQ